jgi:hypothetical protein
MSLYWQLILNQSFIIRLCALLLGRLRMSIDDTIEEVAKIGAAIFPQETDVIATPEANMTALRDAIENMLQRHQHSVDIKLNDEMLRDSRCKV